MSDRGYFVFGFHNDKVNTLLGSSLQLPDFEGGTLTEEEVRLPKQFLLGSKFKAYVYRSEINNSRHVAFIPIGARPLAL